MRAIIILDDDSPAIAELLTLLRDHGLITQPATPTEAAPNLPGVEILLRSQGLTARECQLVCLDLQDFSRAEIANRLGLAPATLKTHWRAIYDKLGIRRRAHLRQWIRSQLRHEMEARERAIGENTPGGGSE